MSPLPRYQPQKTSLQVTATDFQRGPGTSRYREKVGPVPVPLPVDGSDIPTTVQGIGPQCVIEGLSARHTGTGADRV